MNPENTFVTLASLCSDISYGYTASANENVVGPKFLRITDIQGGEVEWANVPYCEIDDKNFIKNKLAQGDIVVARTGNSTGENYFFDSEYQAVFASYLIRFRVNNELANPYFVWLQMRTHSWWGYVAGSKSGSAQAGANAKVLGQFEFFLPKREIQNEVVKIFLSIRKKLRLNTQTNQTLEQIAQAIFKSWFVGFDPVKAKMTALAAGGSREDAERAAMCAISGKDESLLATMQREQPAAYAELAATAALFPAAMQASELGDVPEGWEVTPVKSFGRIVTEKTPPKKIENSYSEHGIPFITPTDVNNEIFVTATGRHLSKEGQESIAKTEIRAGSICVTCIGSQMGKSFLSPTNAYTNQQINSIVVTEKIKVIYLLLNLRNRRGEIFLIGSSGSTMPIINKSTFEQLRVILPCNEVLKRFDKAVCHIIEQILQNSRQNIIFELLRDTLLPKLLSGEIDLSNLPDPAEVA